MASNASSFTELGKQQLADQIGADVNTADRWSRANQAWEVAFRVGILLLGIATAACSGVASTDLVDKPKNWSVAGTVLASTSVLLSSFAFGDFAFHKRQRLYEKKKNALRALIEELRHTQPNEKEFLKRLAEVRSWNDRTDPDKVS